MKMLFIMFPLAVLALMSGCDFSGDYVEVISVDGEPVVMREYRLQLSTVTAGVFQYFYEKYGAEDSIGYWDRNFGGEIPGELAKKKAFDKCVDIKIRQILMREAGLIKDISYRAFMKALAAENDRRRKTIAEDEVIYGPEQYGEIQYFEYLLDNLQLSYANKQEAEAQIDESVLKDYYLSIRNPVFSKGNVYRIKKIACPFIDETGLPEAGLKKEAAAEIKNIEKKLDQGVKWDDLVKTLPEGCISTEFDLNPASRNDAIISSDLLITTSKFEPGQTSNIMERNTEFAIVRLIEKRNLGFQPFDEVQESLKKRYLSEEYGKLVAKRIRSAVIHINKKIYDSIKIRKD
ncbi:MAG: hypothetical protein JW969_03440 [Spirochaetales bacterium]|nr:hypothetical protein [Spirochaetales bacterium]